VPAVHSAVATTMPMIAATIAPNAPLQPIVVTTAQAATPPRPPQTTMPRMLASAEPRW
jgi:hypothetical protein